MVSGFAKTPQPPYYAVVFTSRRTAEDNGYDSMSKTITEMAIQQPGCLGLAFARESNGLGISVS